MKGVIELVENCANTLHVDKNRIYIIGLSMGGWPYMMRLGDIQFYLRRQSLFVVPLIQISLPL